MKERSINDLHRTQTPDKKKPFSDIYSKIKEKYRTSVPELVSVGESLTSNHSRSQKIPDVTLRTPKRRNWPNTHKLQLTHILNKDQYSESIYIQDDSLIEKQQKMIPPLIQSIRNTQPQNRVQTLQQQIEGPQQQSADPHQQILEKKTRFSQGQNLKSEQMKEDKRTAQKNKILEATVNVLHQFASEEQKSWISREKNNKQLLCGILVNKQKHKLYLKHLQEQSIEEFQRDRQSSRKLVKNNQLISCLLAKIQQCRQRSLINPKIVYKGEEIQIDFTVDAKVDKPQQNKYEQRVAQAKRQLRKKQQFMEEVKNQYDKIINNYATTIMNMIKENQSGELANIPETQKLEFSELKSSRRKIEGNISQQDNDERQERDEINKMEPLKQRSFKLNWKYSFGESV